MRAQKGNTGSRALRAGRGTRGGVLRNGKYESEEDMRKPLTIDFLATWLEDFIKILKTNTLQRLDNAGLELMGH